MERRGGHTACQPPGLLLNRFTKCSNPEARCQSQTFRRPRSNPFPTASAPGHALFLRDPDNSIAISYNGSSAIGIVNDAFTP